jgi:hypothetical protein
MTRQTRRLFPIRRPAPTIHRMAHNSLIISTAAEVVLDKRYRTLEAKCAEATRRMAGGPEHTAAAEFWAAALQCVAAEMDRAGLDGRGMVQTVQLQHRHQVAM